MYVQSPLHAGPWSLRRRSALVDSGRPEKKCVRKCLAAVTSQRPEHWDCNSDLIAYIDKGGVAATSDQVISIRNDRACWVENISSDVSCDDRIPDKDGCGYPRPCTGKT